MKMTMTDGPDFEASSQSKLRPWRASTWVCQCNWLFFRQKVPGWRWIPSVLAS